MLYYTILTVLIVINVLTAEGDPCSPDVYKKLPHLESRYMNYMTDTAVIQDSTLITNWYYTGDVTILNRHPDDIFQCGTKFPIWLKDPLPYQYNQEKKATACYMSFGGYFCINEFSINITRCPDGFFVYKLTPTASDSAYCFGVGKSGDPPTFTPNKPQISSGLQTLVDETSPRKITYTEAFLKCIFEPSASETLLYRVLWYQNGVPLYTSGYGTSTDNVTLFLTEPLFVENGFSLGNQISCEVQAFYEEMAPPGPRSERSDPFFAGIEILTPLLSFPFGEEDVSKRTIRLKPTMPIGCVLYHTDSCYIELLAYIPKGANENQCNILTVEGRRCGVQIQSKDALEMEVAIVVAPADAGQYLSSEVYNEVHLRVAETYENKIWANYALEPIRVHMTSSEVKLREGSRCDARNDPHMRTFDKLYYELQFHLNHHAGVYTLYHNDRFNTTISDFYAFKLTCTGGSQGNEDNHKMSNEFEIGPDLTTDSGVQIQVFKCNSKAYCTCGIAALAGQDLFYVSLCDGRRDFNYRSCGDQLLKVKSYKELNYEIYFPYGTYVQFSVNRAFKTFSPRVQPSVYDEGRTSGLCGSLDGNKTNDFTSKNGRLVERDTYIESWRVKSITKNMFDDQFDLTSLTPMAVDVCICEKDNANIQPLRDEVSCDRNAVATCRRGKDTSKDMCPSSFARKRRSVDRRPKFPKAVSEQKLFRTKREIETWTREEAESFCTHYMMNDPIYPVCEQVPNARPEEAISDCIEDIMLTNGTEWADNSLETMRLTCVAELSRNISLWTTGYNSVSIAETVESLKCTNNCSQQGVCTEGECLCNDPYAGVDCSVDKHVPPEMYGLLDDGLCDERNIPCTDAHVFAYPLIDSSSVTCHLSEFAISINGVRKHIAEHSLAAEFVTLVETVCPLEGIRNKRAADVEFVYGYVVNISYDGVTASDGKDLYIYDSTCQDVEIDGQIVFSLKVGFCFIDGKCVAHEQPSILDNCSMCDTTKSLEFWSQNIYNADCNFTTSTQMMTTSTTSKASAPTIWQTTETVPPTSNTELYTIIPSTEKQQTPTSSGEPTLPLSSTVAVDTFSTPSTAILYESTTSATSSSGESAFIASPTSAADTDMFSTSSVSSTSTSLNTQHYSTDNNHPQISEQKLWIVGVAVPCCALAAIVVVIVVFIKISKPKVDALTNRREAKSLKIPQENMRSLTPVEDMDFGMWPAIFGEPHPEIKPPASTLLFTKT